MAISLIDLKIGSREGKRTRLRKRIDKKDNLHPVPTCLVTYVSKILKFSSLHDEFAPVSRLMFGKTFEQRRSLDTNRNDQQDPTMAQPTAQAAHRRAMSEPVNDYYRHKLLPRLPHEFEMYRSRSLPELPSDTSNANHRPPSKYAPEVPPYKNRPLPSPPLRTSKPATRASSTVETICMPDAESCFPYWSEILLLKFENVGNWEAKLSFAREMQDCWTKRELFAHEVRECALDCACGMI